MPFVAKHVNTGDLVTLESNEQLTHIRLTTKPGDYCCPFCDRTMFPRSGKTLPHWYHQPRPSGETGCAHERQPEGRLHLLAKRRIKKFLEKEYAAQEAQVAIVYEHRFANAGENGRIADVAVLFPNGYHRAIEVQISPISVEDLRQRTRDYTSACIDVTWFFAADIFDNKLQRFAATELPEIVLINWEESSRWQVL